MPGRAVGAEAFGQVAATGGIVAEHRAWWRLSVRPAAARGATVNTMGPADQLLASAASREQVRPSDARAGAVYERVVVGGDAYFVKRLSPASDWIMRITGDHVHRPYLVWQAGIMDRVPDCIDHAVVAMQVTGAGDDAVLTMVMRDVGGFLVPPGDTVLPSR